ncbi:hypothetical protein O3P69_007332 [Scylla paramamosain]|uniref:Uncharacterized protein n=1 Tax=Scylla paramamosain TaxID=85552 RepID=A0AAW0V3A4_SCYPA
MVLLASRRVSPSTCLAASPTSIPMKRFTGVLRSRKDHILISSLCLWSFVFLSGNGCVRLNVGWLVLVHELHCVQSPQDSSTMLLID